MSSFFFVGPTSVGKTFTAKKIAKDDKLKITFLDEKQAAKKGMGASVGVAQGAEEPSYMIALEYAGDLRSKEKWGIVGKGISPGAWN